MPEEEHHQGAENRVQGAEEKPRAKKWRNKRGKERKDDTTERYFHG